MNENTDFQAALAVPDLEALILLSCVSLKAMRKSELSLEARYTLGRDQGLHCVYLAYIDSLVKTGLLLRLDHRFYISPLGEIEIERLKSRCKAAVSIILD